MSDGQTEAIRDHAADQELSRSMSHICPSCGTDYGDHLGLIGTCRQLQEARRRLAVKCQHPNVEQCAKLWHEDANQRQLKAVDPALADEFPFGCDIVEHLAEALVAARATIAELRQQLKEHYQ